MKVLGRHFFKKSLCTVVLLWLTHQFTNWIFAPKLHSPEIYSDIERIEASFKNRIQHSLNCTIEFSLEHKTIVNPHDFRYLINNPDLCGTSQLSYVVYIHASPSLKKVSHRNYIRKTWGKVNILTKHPSRLVFFFGRPKTQNEFMVLYKENEKFRDIVMEDYIDSYRNLTHKSMGALKWLSTYCNNTDFYIKSDDDYHVNIWTLMQDLLALRKKDCKFIYCWLIDFHPSILREKDGGCAKWCIPSNLLPREKVYPTYCSGHTYSFTSSISRYLFEKSLTHPYFPIDDAFITGIVPNEVPKLLNHYNHRKSFPEYSNFTFQEQLSRHLLFPSYISIPFETSFRRLWDEQIYSLTKEQIYMTDKHTLRDWQSSNDTFLDFR